MHGLICKAFESFIRATWSDADWAGITRDAGMARAAFESMQTYPDDTLARLLPVASRHLGRRPQALLEDAGHWIVTAPRLEAVRRLIRFSGATYEELIWSLGELRARARLAVPDLDLPDCSIADRGGGCFEVSIRWPRPGAAPVLAGMLRAMADDFGALALIDHGAEHPSQEGWGGTVTVKVIDMAHAAGRDFALGTAS